MSTPDWKRTASLGTAEAAAMREADERRRLARDPSPRRMAPVDEAQTALILDLRERLARLEGAALGYRNLLQAGGGGGAHPFKVIDASDAGGPKVRVLPGTVYVSIAPTVGGVSILAEPPPTISTEQSGFLVMRSTWPDDFVPRCVPLSVVIEFEPGDPSASYSPPNADTRTSARMVFGRVWVADGRIVRLFSEVSRNVVMERQIYDNGDTSVKHIAFGR